MKISKHTLEVVAAILDTMSLPVTVDNFLEKAQEIDTARREIRDALDDLQDIDPDEVNHAYR